MFLVLFAAVFVGLFYYYCVRPLSYWKNRGVQQGNPVWLFGDTLKKFLEMQSSADQDKMLYDRFPNSRYHGVYNFTLPSLYIRDPELIKRTLVKDFDHFTDRIPFTPKGTDALWSKTIHQLQGREWKNIRLLLTPAFTSSKIRILYNLVSDYMKVFVGNLLKKGDTFELNISDIFGRFTADVIASTALGVKVDSLTNPNNEFYLTGIDAVKIEFREFLRISTFWLFGPKLFELFKITLSRQSVIKFFVNLINDAITTREKNNIVRPDMLQLLMDTKKEQSNEPVPGDAKNTEDLNGKGPSTTAQLTNEDIAAQAFLFYFAGFETVSSLLIFSTYELALNPDIQKKLREEIYETYNKCDGNITCDSIMQMPYMDMVVSESMRKWPNMIAFNRLCSKPYTIEPVLPHEKPLHLEEGSTLIIPVCGFHHDPKYFPEPEKFDPERFNEENKGKINPYAYLPFGLGPRSCIGARFALMEAKTFLFQLLYNFEIYPVEKTQIPVKICQKTFGMRPEGKLILGFRRLKNI